MAPSARARWSAAPCRASWASSATDGDRSSPITARRSVECPTRNPAFTPTAPSSRPSHSPKESHDQSSPACERGERHALHPGHHPGQVLGVLRPTGASENPQLPPSTVVTPWRGEGLAVGSQNSWAS